MITSFLHAVLWSGAFPLMKVASLHTVLPYMEKKWCISSNESTASLCAVLPYMEKKWRSESNEQQLPCMPYWCVQRQGDAFPLIKLLNNGFLAYRTGSWVHVQMKSRIFTHFNYYKSEMADSCLHKTNLQAADLWFKKWKDLAEHGCRSAWAGLSKDTRTLEESQEGGQRCEEGDPQWDSSAEKRTVPSFRLSQWSNALHISQLWYRQHGLLLIYNCWNCSFCYSSVQSTATQTDWHQQLVSLLFPLYDALWLQLTVFR